MIHLSEASVASRFPRNSFLITLVSSQRMHSNWSKWVYLLQIFTRETNIRRQNQPVRFCLGLITAVMSLKSVYLQAPELSPLDSSPPVYASSGSCWVLVLAINILLFLLVLLWSNVLLCFYSKASLFSKLQLKYTHLLISLGDFPSPSLLFLLFLLCWSADKWFSRDLRYSLL